MAATNIQTFAGQVEVTSNLTVATDTLHVDSVSGRVGVGKTDPAFAMDVDGTVNATALYVGGSEIQESPWTESGSDIYYTGGNVGIGLTNPLGTLSVSGDLLISNNSIDNSLRLYPEGGGAGGDYEAYGDLLTNGSGVNSEGYGGGGSISADGNYITVPDYKYNSNRGRVKIYTVANKANGNWTLQTTLYGSDNTARHGRFGENTLLNPTGNEVYIAQTFDSGFGYEPLGHVYTYTRTGNSWSSTPSQIIIGSDYGSPASGSSRFGKSMEISMDGSTLAIQGWAERNINGGIGVTKIYTKSGSQWVERYANASPDDTFEGQDAWWRPQVALSSDGSVIAIAEYRYNLSNNIGRLKILTKSGSTWVLNTTITESTASSFLGRSLSMNVDGSKIIATTRNINDILVIEKVGASWSVTDKFTPVNISGVSSATGGFQLMPDGESIHIPKVTTTRGDPGYLVQNVNGTWTVTGSIVQSEYVSSSPFQSIRFTSDGSGVRYIPWAGTSGTLSSAGALQQLKSLGQDVYLVSTADIKANGTILSFTGQHRCSTRGYVEQGLVVSASENKYVSLNGDLRTGAAAINISESLPVVSLSNVVNDSRVFGVVDSVEFHADTTRKSKINNMTVIKKKEKGDDKAIINSIGEGAVWVINTNGPIKSGDYLTTSNIAGYAQKQDDDILHNYTVGKITMDCDFNPKSVPVQIIKKDEHGENVLDNFGHIIWENTDDMIKEYNIRYLDIDEKYTDESNAVYTAAFVGCTYHCG